MSYLLHIKHCGVYSPGGPHASQVQRCSTKWWGVWIFWVLLIHRHSGSKSSRWSGQPIHAIYIRELWRNNSIIPSGCLCACGTIQPSQEAVLINSVWAGVKPLFGFTGSHLKTLSPAQAAMTTRALMSFIWPMPILLKTVYQWYQLIDSPVFVIPVETKNRGLFKCLRGCGDQSQTKGMSALEY